MGRYFGPPRESDRTPEEDLERAQLMLAAVQAQGEEVAQLGAALRYHNDRNHYGEKMAESMRRAR